MKLEQLTHVVEVANTQSISRAASNLLISQPGLSTSIKQLEYELGTQLFLRSKKGVELTQTGRDFVVYAKKILASVEAMEKLCKEQSMPISQTLSVAACHFRYVSAAVAMMLRKHKEDGARFVTRNGVTSDCIDWVADGICDIGLVYYRADEEKEFKKLMQLKQLRYGVIYETQAHAVIGKGHPLYGTDVTEIDARELLRYPMVAYDQTVAKEYFRSVFLHNQTENLRAVITDRASLCEMLEFSDCYSIGLSNETVYRNVPQQQGTQTLKVINGDVSRRYKVAWIASANVEFLPLAQEMIDLWTLLCTCPDLENTHPQYY